MSDTLSLAYCLQFQGEHFTVGDLIKITTNEAILLGRLNKITTNSVVLDCSEQYHSRMVSVPIANIVKVSPDLTIESQPMEPIKPPTEDGEPEPEPDPVANVNNAEELKLALANNAIETINILDDINTIEKFVTLRPVVINGGGHTIYFVGATAGWNSTYVLQAYNAKGVVINDLKITGGDAGLLVNGAEVTLTGTIDVSGNEFGGIEVSQGSGVVNEPTLTLSSATLVNTTEQYGVPTIWEDKVTGRVVGFTGTATEDVKEGQVQYYTKTENSVTP